jgi:preprotein translocase subunit SecG
MTAWLSAIFFASSFGLAVIADNRTASEEDLGFEIPMTQAADTDMPLSDMPVMDSQGDLPLNDAPAIEGE